MSISYIEDILLHIHNTIIKIWKLTLMWYSIDLTQIFPIVLTEKKNPVQDPAREHTLHLVIMSLQSLLIWNTFSVFVHYIDIFEEHGPATL